MAEFKFCNETSLNADIEINRLPLIFKSIKDIDQDNNGYVTTTELEDIIRIHYPELRNKNLKKAFKPYASIQNRILIDYKKLRKDLIEKIKQKMTLPKTNSKKDENASVPDPPTFTKTKTKLNSLTRNNLDKLCK